jgi:hypothetical protein
MARLKFKQILSNLHYDEVNDQLIQNWDNASGSWEDALGTWDGSRANIPDFVIYGSTFVTSSTYTTGSITINGVDTFGDSGSFDTVDLGEY